MVSLLHYFHKTGHIGNSLDDFYGAIKSLESSYRRNEIDLPQLLGSLAGLFFDKTSGELRNANIPEKVKCVSDKLLELASQHELGHYVQTWFVVEILAYELKSLKDPEPLYQFVSKNIYLSPEDALNSFNALLRQGRPVPGRLLRLICAYMIVWGGCGVPLDRFEEVLALSHER